MNTPNSSKKRPMSQIASHKEAGCEDTKIDLKRPKLERRDAEPMLLHPPFCQTPSPITASQNYIQKLILERWEAEVKACEQAKKLQLLEVAPGPAISILQASIRRLVIERWDAEVKRCGEAKWAQLLEEFPTRGGIKRHIANRPKCRRAWELTIEEKDLEDNAPSMENHDAGNSFSPLRRSWSNSFEADEHNPPVPKSRRVMVKDVADEGEVVGGGGRYFKQCSDGGWALREGKTEFERYQKYKEDMGEDKWAPFCDKEEWGLAEWLVKSLGQTRTDEFLKLPITRNRMQTSFHNNRSFLKKVDELPHGATWVLRSYSKGNGSEGLQPQLVRCAPFPSIAPYFRML
ncbi:hypothetical protein BD769DRAFT_1672750 [Suillus cothurnatus]|nr:hypothetical protein BD769DRAFT_1672750 [Suillus cothurnatus]